jgi:hypothetical protein
MLNKAAEYEGCVAQRTTGDGRLHARPSAGAQTHGRRGVREKALPGDEEMIVHTATSFLCLPENVDPATVKEKQLRGEPPLSKP